MKSSVFSIFSVTILALLCSAASVVDISDEQAVINDIQGVWVGYEHLSGAYRHVKLKFADDGYEGWIEISEAAAEPEWAEQPGETGLFSLSSVLSYTQGTGKFRMIRFTILGSCCGDNSLTAYTLSRIITYDDKLGLYVAGQQVMRKK
jgi:hypothetical protein